MGKIRTHYDNLQVARNASPEVIRAAYKGLAQRYHPDRHPNDRERCERIMKIINTAFDVLGDPEKRAAHDAWIAQQQAQKQDDSMQPDASWRRESEQDYKKNSLNRAWQEVYRRYPMLDINSGNVDEMAVAAQWIRMQLLMNDGADAEHALWLSADRVTRKFVELRAVESARSAQHVLKEWYEPDGRTHDEIGNEMFGKYPILSRDEDFVVSDAIVGLYHEHVARGMNESSAWRTAYERVGSRFSVLWDDPDEQVTIKVHPWRRFFARYVDMFLLMFVGYFIASFSISLIDQQILWPVGMAEFLVQAAIAISIAIIVETAAVNFHGRTFGKWLFNLKIEGNAGSPTIKESFIRTLDMTVCGMGFYIPFLYLILSAPCYYRLTKRGTIWWDSAAGTKVVYGDLTRVRLILCAIVVVALMMADVVTWPVPLISTPNR